LDPSRYLAPDVSDRVAVVDEVLQIDILARSFLLERVAELDHLDTLSHEGVEDVRADWRAFERSETALVDANERRAMSILERRLGPVEELRARPLLERRMAGRQ
jgi:hypothetical protein